MKTSKNGGQIRVIPITLALRPEHIAMIEQTAKDNGYLSRSEAGRQLFDSLARYMAKDAEIEES